MKTTCHVADLPATQASADEFYPTPEHLIRKMFTYIKWDYVTRVLEPSAGKGDIARAVRSELEGNHSYRCNYKQFKIECIEIDPNLQHILRGEKFRVIHNDFLTYKAYTEYDLIIMNPPFSQGDKHLLKALDMQRSGGQICCVLNAETLLNPCTMTRQRLATELAKYGDKVKISFVDNEFNIAGTERKTNAQIAIVYVNNIEVKKDEEEQKSYFYENATRAKQVEEEESAQNTSKDIIVNEFVKQIVDRYDIEVNASLNLVREYRALKPYILDGFEQPPVEGETKEERESREVNNRTRHCLLTLSVNYGESNYSQTIDVNSLLYEIRYKYWSALFNNREFMNGMTTSMAEKYRKQIENYAEYDFSIFNIMMIIEDMNNLFVNQIDVDIENLYKKLSEQHSWYPECSNNIHYYNGWATNKAHYVNQKVIIPTRNPYGEYSWNKHEFYPNVAYEALTDIERALNYLDGNRSAEINLRETMRAAERDGELKKIQCKYFHVTFYKKGTCHITFTNTTVLDRLNIYIGRKRNWLPPYYGKVRYEEMSPDAKVVVDEFQGKEKYNKILADADYYLANPTANAQISLLNEGNGKEHE